jgi:Ser/Thr protein kinase RdoA (MazF antagonist)
MPAGGAVDGAQKADRAEIAGISMISRVCEDFGLGPATAVARIAEGLMNRNWRVSVIGGERFVVKEILDIDAVQVAFQHHATRALAGMGLPVPAPLRAPDGDTVLHQEGAMFSVTPWVAGEHVPGRKWPVHQCGQVGRLLGQIHLGLAETFPEAVAPVRPKVLEAAGAKADIDRYLGLIAERPQLDEFDRHARAWLTGHRELLERVALLRPDEDVELEPAGYVHGDFHGLNLLFSDGDIAAVLDWDRMGRRRAYGYEMARSATLLFPASGESGALDLRRVAAFAAGYRSVVAISDDQITASVRQLWWERVCDLWLLQWRYLRGDTSCDHLFRPSSALVSWWSTHLDAVDYALTSS